MTKLIALLTTALVLLGSTTDIAAVPPTPLPSPTYTSPTLLPGQPSEPRLDSYCPESHFRASSFSFEYVVESTGAVTHARFVVRPAVTPACPAFHNAYLRWLRSRRFKPALSGGKPVGIFVTAQALIHFR